MNLHEYQAKEILSEYGLPILPGVLCYTPGEAEAAYDILKSDVCVIKAQVHAGGRGKAGGVKLVKSSNEAREVANAMLGMRLVTPQTGEKGKLVRKIYVESGCNIDKELYLSLLVDRAKGAISFIGSSEGGMDIEEVAESNPEKIQKLLVNTSVGVANFQILELALSLGINLDLLKQFKEIIEGLYQAFLENDFSLIEINPLVITKEGGFVLLDAKVNIDDNGLFRNEYLAHLRDYDEMDPRDLAATKYGLSYVGLDGNIGCMVNGAGLAMATMDIIKQYGGEPANFLDVGGGADKDTVTEAFKILLEDENVKAILVNIFGGIMKCDVIAEGIVSAAKELKLTVPLVVRLQGTNVDIGKDILKNSGLKIIPAETMADAAEKVVAAVN